MFHLKKNAFPKQSRALQDLSPGSLDIFRALQIWVSLLGVMSIVPSPDSSSWKPQSSKGHLTIEMSLWQAFCTGWIIQALAVTRHNWNALNEDLSLFSFFFSFFVFFFSLACFLSLSHFLSYFFFLMCVYLCVCVFALCVCVCVCVKRRSSRDLSLLFFSFITALAFSNLLK